MWPKWLKLQGSGGEVIKASPEGELLMKPPSQVVLDEHFLGTSFNTDIWIPIFIGGGSVTVVDSFAELAVTTANGDESNIHSEQKFVHIFSQTFSFRCGIILNETSLNNNTREWGVHNEDTNDGLVFRLKDGVLEIVTLFNGVETVENINSYKPTDGFIHRYDMTYRNYKAQFIIDGVLVHEANATAQALYQAEDLAVHFHNMNTGITSAAAILKIEGVALFDDSSSSVGISGKDDTGLTRKVAVDEFGNLRTAPIEPVTPPGAVRVTRSEDGDLSGRSDDIYVITDEKTLEIQALFVTAAASLEGSVVEMYWDEFGAYVDQDDLEALGLELLVPVIQSGSTFSISFASRKFLGDITAQIVMRRERLDGGAKRVFGRWVGFER